MKNSPELDRMDEIYMQIMVYCVASSFMSIIVSYYTG